MATPNRPSPDTIISSEWGAWVHDSVVYRCTSTTRPTTPQVGMTVYETDTARLMVYSGTTVGWTLPWSQPWGVVARATSTNTTGPIGSTATDIYDLTVTVPAMAGRLYRTTVHVPIYQQAGDTGFVSLALTDSTNGRARMVQERVQAGAAHSLYLVHVEALSSGPSVRKARIEVSGGTGTIAFAPDHAATLLVEDIGPAGNPS